MKPSVATLQSLENMPEVRTNGDIRRIVSNAMLALVRKEISATDLEALAKGCDAISNSLNAEVKVARTAIELREKGADLGKVQHLGGMLIGADAKQEATQ